MHAGPLDVALRQGRLELDALGHVRERAAVVAHEVLEGASHVVGEGLVFPEATRLHRPFEGPRGCLVGGSGPGVERDQAGSHLTESAPFVEGSGVFEALGPRLRSIALQVVPYEDGARKFPVAAGEHLLALGLGNLLEESFHALSALLVAKGIDDAAGGVVEQGVAVAPEVFVRVRSSIEGLDVFVVQRQRGRGVFDDLLPIAQRVVTGGAVGVEDGVRLADDGLGVELDGVSVLLGAVCLVAGVLQSRRRIFALLFPRQRDRPRGQASGTWAESRSTVLASTSGNSSSTVAAATSRASATRAANQRATRGGRRGPTVHSRDTLSALVLPSEPGSSVSFFAFLRSFLLFRLSSGVATARSGSAELLRGCER